MNNTGAVQTESNAFSTESSYLPLTSAVNNATSRAAYANYFRIFTKIDATTQTDADGNTKIFLPQQNQPWGIITIGSDNSSIGFDTDTPKTEDMAVNGLDLKITTNPDGYSYVKSVNSENASLNLTIDPEVKANVPGFGCCNYKKRRLYG